MKFYSMLLVIFILFMLSNFFASEVSLAAGERIATNALINTNIGYVTFNKQDVPICRYQNRSGNIDVGVQYPGQSEDDIEWVWQGRNVVDPFPRLKALQDIGVCSQDESICRYQNRSGNIDVGVQYPGQSEDDIEWVWQGRDVVDPFPRLKELQDIGVCSQDESICRYQNRSGNIDVGVQYPGQSEDDIEWVWQGRDVVDPFPRLKELQDMGVCN